MLGWLPGELQTLWPTVDSGNHRRLDAGVYSVEYCAVPGAHQSFSPISPWLVIVCVGRAAVCICQAKS